ncbi:MAG: biotin/lipoyl-binding protein [Clostridia bacterium]|jgi:biotin carboxyl carrier protein|nr:biotin/lipoyl-binding protein [Clostridia bacterium]MCI2000868.1 biotin/lipoyl-binding protein [Clostridia bacterium]MCI2015340.1 biotin/lipoyl-binding protein [Clostridia bacterium]
MKYIVTLNGKKYEVEVEKGTATAVYAGKAEQAEQDIKEQSVSQQKQEQPLPKGSGESINAPMPGLILKVNCSAGMKVKAGDVLFVFEAMKMENEITSPKDCTVTDVYVTKGTQIKTGTALCSIA